MQRIRLLFLFLFLIPGAMCSAGLEEHYKKCEHKVDPPQMKGVDYIYLINLDKRPERLEACLKQLLPYGISPYRFSAVVGKEIPPRVLNEIGLIYCEGMDEDRWVNYYPPTGNGTKEYDYLREACYGKTYFAPWMGLGAIGCTLSHLSILQDAYDSGYETIWVMEDDICIKEDPHKISGLIEKLDMLCGKDGWDVFYTDNDESFPSDTDLEPPLWWMWRPDNGLPSSCAAYARRRMVSEDFAKIGSRWRTHSMIIRRSGMKKILDYEKRNHIFSPYDHEIAMAPTIQLYMLRYPLVTWSESPSDIQGKQ